MPSATNAAATTPSQPETMNKRYVLLQARTKQELDRILDVIWAANHTPYEPLIQLFFPVLGYTTAHREKAIAESKARFWAQLESSLPASGSSSGSDFASSTINWFYVLDTVTEQTVGCAQWVVSRADATATIPRIEAPWWPEGEHREFCESILNQAYRPRATWMRKPHCALNWMAVHPSHRSRGIGSQLMEAGISVADELGLECWMEASGMGKPLYERFGFQTLLEVEFEVDKNGASDVWKRCVHELSPKPLAGMWRPKKGEWDAGTVLPWYLGRE